MKENKLANSTYTVKVKVEPKITGKIGDGTETNLWAKDGILYSKVTDWKKIAKDQEDELRAFEISHSNLKSNIKGFIRDLFNSDASVDELLFINNLSEYKNNPSSKKTAL